MTIKAFIVDDHEIVRRGFETLLQGSDIKLVGEAANADEAMDRVPKKKPDVIVVDIRLPGEDGFALMEKLRKKMPHAKFVVFTAHDNATYIARSVALGASDFVLKGVGRKEIVDAITCAYRDDIRIGSSLLRRVRPNTAKKVMINDEERPLTKREMEVLKHITLGLTNIEIGRVLKISVETVKEHVQNLLRKIRCDDRTAAAVWAVRNEIV